MTLSCRENTLATFGTAHTVAATSYTVTAYPVGALASAGSSGTTITVDAGHSFRAGDKYLINPGVDDTFSGTDTVQSVTATTVVMGQSVSVSAGDVLVNLGPDTGTSSPNYDASPVAIYSDADGSTAISNSRVTCSAAGEYSYYHKGDGRFWELIRDSDGDVADVIKGFGGISGWVNVMDYGAAGDGTTEDQAALNAALLTGASEVYFPAGTYLIDSDSSTPNDGTEGGIAPVSNQTLRLAPDAILKAKASSSDSGNIIRIRDLSNVRVLGGQIDGNLPNYSGSSEFGFGLSLWGSSNIWVTDVFAKDCWGDGFYIDEGTGSGDSIHFHGCTAERCRRQGMSIVVGTRISLTNCIFRDTGTLNGTSPESGLDIEPDAGNVVTDVAVVGCLFESNDGPGVNVALSGDTASGNITITGCVTQNNDHAGYHVSGAANNHVAIVGCSSAGDGTIAGTAGMLITNSDGVLVSGCTIRESVLHGIRVDAASSFCNITGNYIEDAGESGILVQTANHMNVSDNTVLRSGDAGLDMQTLTDSQLTGNLVSSSNQDGGSSANIQLVTNSLNNFISGNTCRQGGEANKPPNALNLQAASNNNYVLGNDFEDGGSATILVDNGTDNIKRLNLTAAASIDVDFDDQITNTEFTDADTTPSVTGGWRFTCNNTGATNITDFDDATEGQEIIVRLDANTTIVHNTSVIRTRSGQDITGDANDFVKFRSISGVWIEQWASTGVIHQVTAGITADVGSSQGDGVLTSQVNEISTCANVGDAVTLPSAQVGMSVVVINNGANSADVFPASGENCGAGADTAVAVAAGSMATFYAYSTTNWRGHVDTVAT